eukprot:TRINITY_DN60997_c0_g1_i1.p1 TRINITY_DN60997_c0_g1~~TRINITY_DN60997_c0_g1_i1.p1  ORF type:complete len:122 (-),score=6.54 TRINITY_DN60997_c0_g1_i1:262-627(-)
MDEQLLASEEEKKRKPRPPPIRVISPFQSRGRYIPRFTNVMMEESWKRKSKLEDLEEISRIHSSHGDVVQCTCHTDCDRLLKHPQPKIYAIYPVPYSQILNVYNLLNGLAREAFLPWRSAP